MSVLRSPLLVPRGACLAIAALLVLKGASGAVYAQASLPQLLEQAGKYVVDYQRSFSAIVSDEHYVQHLHGAASTTRDLRSEVALIAAGYSDWVFFRDVYRVDGVVVSDRQDRLMTLLTKPIADAGAQARRIADESARYNVGSMTRTLNTPMQALAFIQPENQGRSIFRAGKRTTIRDVDVVEVSFQENATPRVIGTSDNAAAAGRLWIAPDTGTIVRTELSVESVGVTASFIVNYARQAELDLWLPIDMHETYASYATTTAIPNSSRPAHIGSSPQLLIDSDATYSNFRRFKVNTNVIIR